MVNESSFDRVDVVIFGASGFTGEHVVRAAIRKQQRNPDFTFKVAGRSINKMREVLDRCKEITGISEFKVDLIEADLNRQDTIRRMCGQAKVLINCVGPYRFYGEQVVKTCIETGTNYVDICGEPQFLEGMQLKYDQQAKERGVYIVGSCGFDSIPSEMGIAFVKQNFEDIGDLESIETYMQVKSGPAGTAVHYGTWESAVHSIATSGELGPLRRQLYKTRLPKSENKVEQKILHFNADADGFAIPFPGSDRSVARRTEYLDFVEHNSRPVQVVSYLNTGSPLNAAMIIVFGLIFGILAKFTVTRNLLLKYPKFFSGGMFSHEGPTNEQIKNTSFLMKLIGRGFSGPKLSPAEVHQGKPSQKIVVNVTGPEPGYAATSLFVFECAMVLLDESQLQMSAVPRPGVLPPGYAFARSDLIKRLAQHGIGFEVVYKGADKPMKKEL